MDRLFTRNLIARLAEENFDFILRKSLKDYHVFGFNSLVLHKSEKLTLRLCVCEPGQTQLNNTRDPANNTLMIHNHRFDFECQALCGYMENLTYVETKVATDQGEWLKYHYHSALLDPAREMRVDYLNKSFLALEKVECVDEGQSYALQHHQLHRIMVPSDRLLIMLFWQHETKNNLPILFSNHSLPAKPDITGLYNCFNKSELKRMLEMVLENLSARS